jgi:hypothetical protein
MNRDPRFALSHELEAKQTLLDQLRALAAEDPDFFTDLIEGETNLLELIAALDASIVDDLTLADGAKAADWLDDAPLDAVPLGQLADRIVAFLRARRENPQALITWRERNRHALREFWARAAPMSNSGCSRSRQCQSGRSKCFSEQWCQQWLDASQALDG